MYLQIKKAKLMRNAYSKNDILISMVGLYDDNWKYVKFIKMEEAIELLLKHPIKISTDSDPLF